jgi:hypothetical protein
MGEKWLSQLVSWMENTWQVEVNAC